MNTRKIGFIGAGHMGGALVCAASGTGVGEILIACSTPVSTETRARELGVLPSDAREVAKTCRVIFLGVKPYAIVPVLSSVTDELSARQDKPLLISMAAGVPLAAIAEALPGEFPIIRMMPNTPVTVGQGMTAYTCSPSVSDEERNLFLRIMEKTGTLDEVPEGMMDAVGALSGSGPAFVYMFMNALADAGVACGMPRSRALLYAEQTVLGSAAYAMESGEHLMQMKDAVCSPGGTTIEGVRTLDNHAFSGTVAEAVIAAYRKTKDLARH